MNKNLFMCLLLVLLLPSVPSLLEADRSDGTVSLTVDPNRIEVGTFYHKKNVNVTANVPLCDGVVLQIKSRPEEVVLNRKGRLGFVWMNVAKVTVAGAPEVYILGSSDEVKTICSPEERDRLQLGLETLRKTISFRSERPGTGDEFNQFLRLKKHRGTYRDDISVNLGPENNEGRTVSATVPLPSVIPVGEYTLRLYCFEEGALVEDLSAPLTIEKSGLPRLESKLAHEHPAAYGVVAVLVAMLAGITMGVIFSSKSG
jgi:uncharacterized protein (TIGR02186 family)